MPFVPKFQEAGESEIIENLMAIVDRDMKQSLDYFYLDTPTYLDRYGVSNAVGAVGQDLPDFAVKTDGDVDAFTYPLLVLGTERMRSRETEDIDESDEMVKTYLNQELVVGAGLVVRDSTSLKNARRTAKKYVRAFKAVIRSATPDDLLPPTSRVLNHTIDIEHRYLRHGSKGTQITQPVEFEIKIAFGEN